MKNEKMDIKTMFYPMPVFLVGTLVDGKPAFLTVAWSGIVSDEPPMISISIRVKGRHSYRGIKENGVFSVNLPPVDMVEQADYCGMVSGAKVDKVTKCGFNIFYANLPAAPMIHQCAVNLECRVVQSHNLGSHDIFIGAIEETYISDDCLTGGKPDVSKIKPFSYIAGHSREYVSLGKSIGTAWSIGRKLDIIH